MTGLNTDAKSQVTNLRRIAHEFRFDYGYDIPVDVLARKIADKAQIYTQQASKRVLAVMTILGKLNNLYREINTYMQCIHIHI